MGVEYPKYFPQDILFIQRKILQSLSEGFDSKYKCSKSRAEEFQYVTFLESAFFILHLFLTPLTIRSLSDLILLK